MKTLFDSEAYNEIKSLIETLTADTERLWGKMDVAQMLAHCIAAFKNALLTQPAKRMLIGWLVGRFFKSQLYNDKPYGKGAPTAPDFVQKDPRDFHQEKARLLEVIERFHRGGEAGVTRHPHPFFGHFTPEQWGKTQYKHIDHHLRQFGA